MKKMLKLAAVLVILLVVPALAEDPPSAAVPGFEPTEQVLIPAGEFTMGVKDSDENTYAPHQVKLSAFYIDKHEVTNAQYQAFCEATERTLPIFWGLERFRCGEAWPDHPVVGVSNTAAKAYAEWCGRRLPTEAEWEYAARGGLEQKYYDRGDDLADDAANTKSSKIGHTSPVASFEPNAYGLYDMVGNVREWVSDKYADDYFANSPLENPTGPETSRWRVVKGGGWFSGKGCNRVHVRNALKSSWADFNVGFRCAGNAE